MVGEIKNILLILNIFLCSVFSIYLITLKKKNPVPLNLFVCFLLAKAFTQLIGIFYHFEGLNSYLLENLYQMFYIPYPFYYLFTPFFYLYILSAAKTDFSFKKTQLLHFIPFLFFTGYIVVNFNLFSSDEIKAFITSGYFFGNFETHVFYLVSYMQFFFYGTASLFALNQYQKRIKQIFSNVEKIKLDWLIMIICGFFGWMTIQTFNYILWISGLSFGGIALYVISEIIFLTFVTILFLKITKHPNLFTKNYEEHKFKDKNKYEKTPLPESMKESIKTKLITHMESDRPYLDPSVNLNNIAEKISVNPHYLSQTLNTSLQQNFYDFINSYRIEESKKLLSDKELKSKTILDIIYESGFNSKSVFNAAFKKITGMTPSEYRKSNGN